MNILAFLVHVFIGSAFVVFGHRHCITLLHASIQIFISDCTFFGFDVDEGCQLDQELALEVAESAQMTDWVWRATQLEVWLHKYIEK